jgi:hypothetical protein
VARRNDKRAVVAAAERIKLNDRKAVKAQVKGRQDWQDDSWDMFDLVPEVKQLTWFLGNGLALLRLFIAVEDPNDPDADPIPIDDDKSGVPPEIVARANAELARLGTGAGGHSEILRLLNMNLEIAGEGYLIGQSERPEVRDPRTDQVMQEAKPERWRVKSVREVEVKDRTLPDGRKASMAVKDDPDDKRGEALDPDLDTAIRFWQQHPAFEKRPDCAMRACLDDCETLLVLKQQLRAEAKSHIPAGLLFAANDLQWATFSPPTGAATDEDEALMHPLMRQLVEMVTASIEDPSHASSLAPGLGLLPVGPNEDIRQKVMHLSLARTSSDTLDARIEKRVATLARGLNAPPEKMMGHQQTTFANAEQVDDDLWEDHYRPRALLVVDVLTEGFLRPQLGEGGDALEGEPVTETEPGQPTPPIEPLQPVPPEWIDKLFVWFDPKDAIKQADPEKNADEAHKNYTISDAAYRKAKGYSDDDKPEPTELLIRKALEGGSLDPSVTVALLNLLGIEIEVEPLPGAQSNGFGAQIRGPILRTTAREMRPITAASRPAGLDAGRQLMAIDRELRSRVLVLADRTMNRALERIGNVARSKSPADVRALLRDVSDPRFFCAALGPTITAAAVDVDAELAEAFDTIEETFKQWGAGAQRQALDLASRISSGFTTSQRDALQLRQASDLDEAWLWTRDALTALAHAKLFDPTAAVAELGETDASMTVPAGLVRQAITRAGGVAGVHTSGVGDAYIALTDAASRPAGGIATGELVMGAMHDHGATTDGYVWDYGPAMRTRPFEPHVDLDGVEFENFDDPVLSNDEGWPPFAFYMPGDHDGCLCDFVPVVSGPSNGGGDEGDSE